MRERSIKEYRGSVLALDIFIQLFRFVIAIRGSKDGVDMRTSNGKLSSHVYGLFHKIMNMLKKGILPVGVSDGSTPDIKNMTINKRRGTKQKAQVLLETNPHLSKDEKVKYMKRTFGIKNQHLQDIEKLLELFGIPYIKSIGEAEAQCAVLNIAKKVDGVITEDWDALPFGTLKMLKDFSNKKPIIEIDLMILLDELDLTKEQFIELCIANGTDYLKGIKGFNFISLYEMYKIDKNMESFLTRIKTINSRYINNGQIPPYDIPIDFENSWREIKDYYCKTKIIEPDDVDLTWQEPQYDKLLEFLCDEFEFPREKTIEKINKLREYYNIYIKNGISFGEDNYRTRYHKIKYKTINNTPYYSNNIQKHKKNFTYKQQYNSFRIPTSKNNQTFLKMMNRCGTIT